MSKQAMIDSMEKRKQALEKKDLKGLSEGEKFKVLSEIAEIGQCLLVLKKGRKR